MEKIKKIFRRIVTWRTYEDVLVAALRPLVLLVLRPKYALRQAGQFLKPRNLTAWVLATRTRKVTASLLVAILVIAPLYGIIFRKETEAAWWNDMWKFRKKLTINKSQVAGELQNFPMLVSLTDTDLSTNAQSDGDDIVFTDAMGHKLSHEIESYTSGTGVLVAWVKIPNLSPAHNQDIYLYYGNSTCQTQQAPTDVWDDNFKMVQHMNQDPSATAPQMLDSTENNNDGTSGGTMTSGDLIDARIGKGIDLDAIDDFINNGSSSSLDDLEIQGGGGMTVSAWIYPRADADPTIIEKGYMSEGIGWQLALEWSGRIGFYRKYSNADLVVRSDDYACPMNNWCHVQVVWDGGMNTNNVRIFINGDESYQGGSNGNGSKPSDSTASLSAGSYNYPTYTFDGRIDEIQVEKVIRSSEWLQTKYNNQSNPSTFLSVNNQQQERPGAPIGYWPLNEGYGTTAHDESGGNNTGTITGATWAGESECVSGACLRFDGSGDEVDAGDVGF